MTAYYNEIDPKAAAWLRELIKQGHIAPGIVDERSIEDITPSDLEGYTQCHFFAGIGVWSYALRRAGWPDDRPIWTGSCPCQPFSAAGKGDGFIDERHLWPAWYHLLTQCEPDRIFGEQVASKDGLRWLDLVQTDLEGAGYANGAVDLCSAGVGAPHIRQRVWFVAERVGNADGAGSQGHGEPGQQHDPERREKPARLRREAGACGGLADSNNNEHIQAVGGSDRKTQTTTTSDRADIIIAGKPSGADNLVRSLADSDSNGRGTWSKTSEAAGHRDTVGAEGGDDRDGAADPTDGLWRDADWLFCRDGKWRPVEPGTFPLVDGAAERVGRLRGYGNAINAEAATTFIEAYLEC